MVVFRFGCGCDTLCPPQRDTHYSGDMVELTIVYDGVCEYSLRLDTRKSSVNPTNSY
jgi:hypothetical protein